MPNLARAGSLSRKITAVPGASDYLDRAFVTYSNRAKTEILGVSEELLRAHGAVSEEVALAMAEGALKSAAVEVSVGDNRYCRPNRGHARKTRRDCLYRLRYSYPKNSREILLRRNARTNPGKRNPGGPGDAVETVGGNEHWVRLKTRVRLTNKSEPRGQVYEAITQIRRLDRVGR